MKEQSKGIARRGTSSLLTTVCVDFALNNGDFSGFTYNGVKTLKTCMQQCQMQALSIETSDFHKDIIKIIQKQDWLGKEEVPAFPYMVDWIGNYEGMKVTE